MPQELCNETCLRLFLCLCFVHACFVCVCVCLQRMVPTQQAIKISIFLCVEGKGEREEGRERGREGGREE